VKKRNNIIHVGKNLVGFLLAIIILMSIINCPIAVASQSYRAASTEQEVTLFISSTIPQDVVDYALNTLPEIAYPIGGDGILSISELSEVSLGSPICFFDFEDDHLVETNKYIFFVLINGEIRASLEILDTSGDMSAAFHASGITQGLSALVNSNRDEQYWLVVDNTGVYAASQSETFLLFDSQMTSSQDVEQVKLAIERAISFAAASKDEESVHQNSEGYDSNLSTILVAPMESIGTVEISCPIDVKATYPTSGAVLMTPVYQSGNNCGSAAIAAIVNYILGTSLTATGVNQAASGSSATASIAQLYTYLNNTHSLYPSWYYGGPPLSTVQSQIIDCEHPMFNVFSTPTEKGAHAMALNGYAQQPGTLYYQHVTTWSGYATHLVVTANSTFSYGGHTFSPYGYGSDF